ncbi:hypothetical protein DFJ77DRAFT_428518 [Powellomyces hirtus]|nr:hypothetical protein DFJ77DRAFT_428518 [Powellomyces hirtus]
MHIILTGATGNVGMPVLQRILATPSITRVSILSRRPFTLPTSNEMGGPTPGPFDASKADIVVHEDYTSYPDSLRAQLRGARGCIWAQGVSQTDVDKDTYTRITYDYPLAAARAFAGLNTDTKPFVFVHVSGEGADPTEKSFMLFGKVKGRAEKDLLALPESAPELAPLRIFNVRPGYVDPSRTQQFYKTAMNAALAPVMRVLAPSMVSPVGELSKVLVDLATGDGTALEGSGIEAAGRTVRSSAIRRLGI